MSKWLFGSLLVVVGMLEFVARGLLVLLTLTIVLMAVDDSEQFLTPYCWTVMREVVS